MKTVKIMILSLLLATQTFAWGKSERSALLGFAAGAVLTHLIVNSNDTNYKQNKNHWNSEVSSYYEPIRREPVHVQKVYQDVHINQYTVYEDTRDYENRHHGKRVHHHKHAHHNYTHHRHEYARYDYFRDDF